MAGTSSNIRREGEDELRIPLVNKPRSPPGLDQTPSGGSLGVHEDKYTNLLVMGGHIISTTAAVLATNCRSEMSNGAEYLLYFLISCIFVTLLSCFYAFFLSGYKRVAAIMRATAIVGTGFGLVTATGLHMPNEVVVWVTVGVLILSAPAILGYAIKTIN